MSKHENKIKKMKETLRRLNLENARLEQRKAEQEKILRELKQAVISNVSDIIQAGEDILEKLGNGWD